MSANRSCTDGKAHFNRAARSSGGDIRFRLEGPSIGVPASWLAMALAKVRHELGQAAVEDFIAEMRKRGDLECTDEQGQGSGKAMIRRDSYTTKETK